MADSADRYANRDEAMLRHASCYGVLLHAPVSRLFFDGKQAGHIVRKLADTGKLSMHTRAIPGGISYARLTASACAQLGVSDKQAAELSGHALDQAIAILCFSTLSPHRRFRLSHQELASALNTKDVPPVPHLLVTEEELGAHAILRVNFATGSAQVTLKQLRQHILRTQRHKTVSSWLATGDYGFCVLAPTQKALRTLEHAISRSGLRDECLIVTGWGPTAETLAQYLRAIARSDTSSKEA